MSSNEEFRAGQELDTRVAESVFGFKVWKKARNLWYESPPEGDRPLRKYSKEIEWAWDVAKKMNVTLIPIIGGQWFAFVGNENQNGWESPQALLKFLEEGKFTGCGAFAHEDSALAICVAAVKAAEKRKFAAENPDLPKEPSEIDAAPSPSPIH